MPHDTPEGFTDVAFLGEGAFGAVYRATDRAGRPVALKVLSKEAAGRPEVAWQFESEYRHLARLDHPAFPRAFEQGRTPAGRPYFSMALIAGSGLDAEAPMEAPRVRERLAALAGALAHLHAAGYVHGDLKPENVRITPEGRLVLIDLGLMAPTGARREGVEGTLAYMAPEVIRQHPVDPAADMYAVGAIAYALWSGEPPFTGDAAALVRQHMTASPPPIAERTADSDDQGLENMIELLLAKDPARRPSAAGLKALLAGEEPPAIEDLAVLGHGAFVGREPLLTAWRDALAAGEQRLLALTAGAGLGKSRTLAECKLEARLAGRTWLQSACLGPAEPPAAPLRALVAQAVAVSGEAPRTVLAAWLQGDVAPELAGLEPASRQVAVGAAAADALAAAARRAGPLAIGLDDWHLADGASQALLGVLRRVEAPIAWAIAGETLPGLTADWAIGPLEGREIEALLASRLGQAPPEGLAPGLASATGGQPRLLEDLLEHLVTTGALVRQGGLWRLVGAAPQAMPASLEAAMRDRFDRLPDASRRLAAVVAAAHAAGPLPAPVLDAALGLGPDALEAAIAPLLAQGLLTAHDGRLRLTLAEAAPALLAEVAPATRTSWARAMTVALADAAPETLSIAALVPAAWLAIESGEAALALPLVAEASARGLALGGPGQALALLTAAEALPLEDAPAEVRLALTLVRAEAERYSDRLEAARPRYESAIALASGRPAALATAWIGLGKCRQLAGDLAGAREAYAAGAEAARLAGDAALEGRASVSEARALALQGDSAAAEARAEAAAAAPSPAIRAQALLLAGYLIIQRDPGLAEAALAKLEEALALARSIGDRVGEGAALDNLGNAHMALGALQEAEVAFSDYAAVCEAAGLATEGLAAGMNRALVAAERGDVDLAVRVAESTRRRALAIGRKFVAAAAATAEAKARWMGGEPELAEPLLAEALETATAMKSALLEEHVRAFRLEARLATRDVEGAMTEAAALAPLIDRTGHAEMAQRLAIARAEAAWLSGEAAEAEAGARSALGATSRVVIHKGWRLLARLALRRGDAASAMAAADAALAIAEGWRASWHMAADLALRAEALSAAGDEAAAREAALAALDQAQENPEARAVAEAIAGVKPSAAAAAALGFDAVALAKAMEAIALAEDEPAIARAALASAIALTGAERGYWLSYEQGRLRQALTHAIDFDDEADRGFSETLSMQALVAGEPLYVLDAGSDPRFSESASVMGLALKTVICLPLATPTKILGVLYMDRQAIDPVLGEADMAGLGALAGAAAAAVFKARAIAEAETGQAVLRSLGASLLAHAPAGTLERELVQVAVATAGAERGFWLVPEGEGFAATAAIDARGRAVAFDRAMISQTIAQHVATTESPLAVLDVAEASDWQAAASVMALGLRTIWCLPVGTPDGALLYMDAERASSGDPTEVLPLLELLLGHGRSLRD